MKNNKLFGFINIFDVIFLGLVIVLVIASYFRYNLASDNALLDSHINLKYTLYLDKVDYRVIDNISTGEMIYHVTERENSYLLIGEIIEIVLIPYREVNSDNIEFYDILLVVSEKGNKLNDDYLSHTNVELHVGKEMDVITQHANLRMKLLDITEV